MKKLFGLIGVMILSLMILNPVYATSIIYDFTLPSGQTDRALQIDFLSPSPGNPSVAATGWGEGFFHPNTGDYYSADARHVHQCEYGLGVLSYQDNNPNCGPDEDQHAVDGWINYYQQPQKQPPHYYVQEILYLTFSQEVTLKNITFTRIDTLDEFAFLVDGSQIGTHHITNDSSIVFEDFVNVDLTGIWSDASDRTGTVFGISTTEGCDDYKIAKLEIDSNPVPEPGTFFLLVLGLVNIIGIKKNHK